jgi:hypothetical protein
MSWTTYYDEVLAFVANEASLVRGPGRQIDWTNVPESFGRSAFAVTTDAQANAAATTISVEALPGALPAGTMLYFGEAGEYARLTAAAAAGATSLTVEALPAQIESGDVAYYNPRNGGGKVVPAGTIMAELASGKVIPRSAVTGAETATHILESSAVEDDDVEQAGYGVLVGGAIFSNLLPDSGDANFDTWIGELETAGVGIGWHWATYADDTSS